MGVRRMLTGMFAVALAVFLSVGAAAAPADVLCEKEPQVVEGVETCPSPYSVESELVASDSEALFSGSGFEVKCKSTIVVKTTKNLGAGKGLVASIPKLTFGSCTGSCTSASAPGLPYGAVISATGGGDGIVTYDAAGDVTLVGCTMLKLTCAYDSTGQMVKVIDQGEKPPSHISTKGWPFFYNGKGSASCPEELALTDDYEVEQPKGAVFVSKS
jgi:hypothetical protein